MSVSAQIICSDLIEISSEITSSSYNDPDSSFNNDLLEEDDQDQIQFSVQDIAFTDISLDLSIANNEYQVGDILVISATVTNSSRHSYKWS